jgi:hypothetical protein
MNDVIHLCLPLMILGATTLILTFRNYFWEIASEIGLHCRDSCNLSFVKPLRMPFQIQTAECGLTGGSLRFRTRFYAIFLIWQFKVVLQGVRELFHLK